MEAQPGQEGSDRCERDRLTSSDDDSRSGQGDLAEDRPAQVRSSDNAPARRVGSFSRPSVIGSTRRARKKRDEPLSPDKVKTVVKSRVQSVARQVP